MPRLQLNLSNLNDLDRGKAHLAFCHALRLITQDIVDRPGDKAKRRAVLIVEALPVLDKSTAALKHMGVTFKVKTSVPDRQTLTYPMSVTADGIPYFQSMSPFDPDQPDLPGAVRPTMQTQPIIDETTGEVLGEKSEPIDEENDVEQL